MSAAATPFRSLVFRGTVPLQVQLEPQDLPLTADRSVEYYYLQVPRVSYLALCLDNIKRNLVQLVLDHASFAALKDDDLWFETLPDNHQAQEATPLRWHWPIGLLYDLHATSRHLGLLPPRPIRTGFMALVKEADYVRWGSTKRVMNLRKELQDNLWEAVVENDFEKYWNVASKLVPLPAPPAVGSKKPTRTTPPSASSSAGEGGRSFSSSQEPDANGIKHVPLRVYLPAPPPSGGGASNGAGVATVVQEPVAPTRRDGSPTTLRQALSQLVPLLFAPLPSSSSSSSSPAAPPPPPPPLAYPLIHGIYPPFETEVGWLGACMAGPDGWVNVVVVLDERGQPDVSGPGASSSL
ncbi:hypothetical protein RHOSPDRAFT_30403 [Rhodotorula sp. JG-1b]|nr:hypothetical protein RHOSPDRAFT_30403 [Rhodotorula sp. JG-1b]